MSRGISLRKKKHVREMLLRCLYLKAKLSGEREKFSYGGRIVESPERVMEKWFRGCRVLIVDGSGCSNVWSKGRESAGNAIKKKSQLKIRVAQKKNGGGTKKEGKSGWKGFWEGKEELRIGKKVRTLNSSKAGNPSHRPEEGVSSAPQINSITIKGGLSYAAVLGTKVQKASGNIEKEKIEGGQSKEIRRHGGASGEGEGGRKLEPIHLENRFLSREGIKARMKWNYMRTPQKEEIPSDLNAT